LKDAKAKSPHESLFSFYTDQLHTVRSGKWKLYLKNPEPNQLPKDSTWIDPRWADGVTILAPYEQPKAHQHPGITTGDVYKDVLLFDLETDPSEQKNVAAQFPEIVKKLKAYAKNARFD
jgi:hypothetical protein